MCPILTLCTEMSLETIMVYSYYSFATTTITSFDTTSQDVYVWLNQISVCHRKLMFNQYVSNGRKEAQDSILSILLTPRMITFSYELRLFTVIS
jgi:hypothetical protein